MDSKDAKPIIIIGAGLVGLTLAQGLKKAGFAFQIYDRDNSIDERPAGWGITMHWALPALDSCVPPELFAQLPSIQVDPIEGAKDLSTGQDKFAIPSSLHYRLNRKKYRQLLCTGIDVNWGKRLVQFETREDSVTVHFADGACVEGSMLLGVDGKNSRIKRALIGDEKAKLHPLPVAFMGTTLRLSPEKMQPFRDIHPILWQGAHPGSGYYIFFSMLSTPQSNGSIGANNEYYEGQFNMSWLVERNGELPKTAAEQIARIKSAALVDSGFFPRLREAVLHIPDDSPVMEIKLEDWPSQEWMSGDGRVSLVGDAAHTMTMYRGEAANHGIYDASRLVHELVLWRKKVKSLDQALKDYQTEVIARTHDAVLKSRIACLECHDLDTLRQDSAVFQVSGFNAAVTEIRPVFDIPSQVYSLPGYPVTT
ncbi:FAD binding domain-containing protein [Thozetella sp. PMI_491]|nr:FAD binding domain-containing protein [Thozetella sp. PMI_491]